MAFKVPNAVVVADTEFEIGTGERPVPVCLVARELRSGKCWRLFQDEFGSVPPFPTGPDTLFVAFYASAELGFFRALQWPMPARILDLFVEFRNLTNGRLSDDAFRQASKAYPIISPLRELRSALSDLRLNDLAVGQDGRNRTILSAFRSKTGRNQPSNTKFIFGPSVWLRGLIKPPPGYGLAYIDWTQQEVGIAAVLSGDTALQAAYQSGDCYLGFAKQAGAVPEDATKATHGPKRELFKQCVLATQYGQGAEALATRIGQPTIVARDLLRVHRETYRKFWAWSDAAVDTAMLTGSLHTVFGWTVHVGENANPRSLRNHPMQGNGAEMLRLACCLATERGIEICAPIHDAVLICAPLDRLEADVARMREAMAEASRIVLTGFELHTDAKLIQHPDRYSDPRGQVMWDRVMSLISRRRGAGSAVA
jgi:DNA polymerase-1